MDDKDWTIINLLRDNSRFSNSEIGRMLNVSEGTIRKRISKLVATGVIKKFTIKTGLEGVDGIILIRTELKKSQDIIKKIKEAYDDVYEFSGRVDLAVRITCNNLDELNRIVNEIRSIDGVKNTDTLIRLN